MRSLVDVFRPQAGARAEPANVAAPETGVSSPGPRMPDTASPSLSVRFTRWVSRSYQVVRSCGVRRTQQPEPCGPLTEDDQFAKQLRDVLDDMRSPFARLFRRQSCQKALHGLALQFSADASLRDSGRAREWLDHLFGALDLTDEQDRTVLHDWWKLARHLSPPLPRAFEQILGAFHRLGVSVELAEGHHVDLSSARLPLGEMLLEGRFYLRNSTLSDEQLEGAVRHFSSRSHFTGAELRRVFNHSDNSVLGAIDVLPAKYHDHKVRLIEQCVGRLETTMLVKDRRVRSELMRVVAEFLLSHPDYIRSSPQIQAFVEGHQLVEQVLRHYQNKVLTVTAQGPERLNAVLDGIEKNLNDSDRDHAQRFARAHGCGIFQMLKLARTSTDSALLAQATAVHQRYLECLPDELAKAVTTLAENDGDETLFPVLAGGDERALVLSDDYFSRCTSSDSASWWGTAYMFDPAHVETSGAAGKVEHIRGVRDIRADLQAAPVLLDLYQKQQRVDGLTRALKFLLPADLIPQVIEELDRTKGSAQTKWTQPAIQEQLSTHITPLLTFPPPPQGRSESVRQRQDRERMSVQLGLQTAANLLSPHKTLLIDERRQLDPRKYEYWCRCWAVTLMQMSGVYHFGEEHDSPFALRQLATAFLNEAHSIARQQRQSSEEEIADHLLTLQKLAGVGDAFTCTSVLSHAVKDPLREQANSDPQLREIYNALIPRAW
ncbi:MAG: hypothetical protein WDO68_04365 [Gammaproteobacteria bacterium]